MKAIRLTSGIRLLLAHLLAFSFIANAGSAGISELQAPALRDCPTEKKRDLGVWDDVFVCDDQDVIVLRRGEGFFSMSLSASASLKKLATAPAARTTRIIDYAGSGDRLWLFLQSDKAAPFAIDARSGKVSHFDVPNPKMPGRHAASIQSRVILRHVDAALLMISGSDRETWPRDGSGPLYFWMSLKSGKVVAFPIGWDLSHFTADQRVAVFEKLQLRRFEHRPLQAVDMKTGSMMAELPDRQSKGVTPFVWTDTQRVKPIYLRSPETRVQGNFAGIAINGSIFPIAIEQIAVGLDKGRYLSTAKVNGAFAGFRLTREGAMIGERSPFWLMSLKQKQSPQLVAPEVTDFAILDKGNCVFITSGHGRRGESSEAFFRGAIGNATWNVLEGVERLPELDKEFVDKSYIEDKAQVRLIDGFGARNSLVLCLFSHFRGDMRANFSPVGKRLEMITWRRAVILTSSGERYMTGLFREWNLPDFIWLHNSGRVVTGNYLESSSGPTWERKLRLSETTVRLRR
jgi:hypothetical protein